MNADNRVVQLCVEGMLAEAEGRAADAQRLFAEAWDASSDDFEASVAAHYVARHQRTPEETLRWNEQALAHAQAVAGDRMRGLYASLHLNVGKSLEDLGRTAEAHRSYERAAAWLDALPADGYGSLVRGAVAAGRERTRAAEPVERGAP